MMWPANPATKDAGLEVPTPKVPAEVPSVRPPEKVEVPRPLTPSRLAILNEVDEATGRIEEPETLNPPAKTESPAETRRPREESTPGALIPPAKEGVPLPVKFGALENLVAPSTSRLPWTRWFAATSRPPANVEVPRPLTLRRFASEREVEGAELRREGGLGV